MSGQNVRRSMQGGSRGTGSWSGAPGQPKECVDTELNAGDTISRGGSHLGVGSDVIHGTMLVSCAQPAGG